jgi:hypothetical protein
MASAKVSLIESPTPTIRWLPFEPENSNLELYVNNESSAPAYLKAHPLGPYPSDVGAVLLVTLKTPWFRAFGLRVAVTLYSSREL